MIKTKERGSATIYVIIAIIFLISILIGTYSVLVSQQADQLDIEQKIKSIYSKGVDNIDEVYKELTTRDNSAGIIVSTENRINQVSDGEGVTVPVPIGFSYLEGTKATGFVIKNDADGNEFVWIPIDLIDEGYATKDWAVENSEYIEEDQFQEYYTSDTTTDTSIISNITASVTSNKGFYIGRYEAGTETKRTAIGDTLTSVVCQQTSTETPIYAYNYVTWDQAISLSEGLYNLTENNCQSRLINGRGWDSALKFIEGVYPNKDATYPTNSVGKGWYTNNASNNVNYEIGKPINENNSNVLKNIYDIGGNVGEWTANKYNSNRE